MQPCRAYDLDVLADYVSRRLSEADIEALRCHLTACPQCRRAVGHLADLRLAMQRAHLFDEQPVPAADHQRIMQHAAEILATSTRRVPRRPAVLRGWFHTRAAQVGLVAAAAVIIVAASVLFDQMSRSAAGPEVGRTVATRGTIFVNERPVMSQAEVALRAGQTIRTGGGALLTANLTGGATVMLNEDTSLAVESAGATQTVCRLGEGQIYADFKPAPTGGKFVVRTSVGVAETAGARFDLRLAPRGLAGGGATLTPLALMQPQILGNIGPQAEVRLTVLSGEVAFLAVGDQTPTIVKADEQLVYDPAEVRPRVQAVRAERYGLWRLTDDEVVTAAQDRLRELFAGQVTVLSGGRVRLDYDFLTARELNDWQMFGSYWTLHERALRMHLPAGQTRLPAGEKAELVSRAAFVGDVEVGFKATVDPARATGVGWELRYAETAGAPIIGATQTRCDDKGALRISLTVDGKTQSQASDRSTAPVFTFGGRLRQNTAYALFEQSEVLAGAVPDAVLRRLYRAEQPEGLRVVISSDGPDVFISQLTLTGRPDPQWLRAALARLYQRDEVPAR